jgi:transcription initiation factor TFIIB
VFNVQKVELKQKEAEKCSQCGRSNFIQDHDSGETICANCGLVVSDSAVSQEPEWRAFTPEEAQSRSRVGMPTSYSSFDKGLSTTIGRTDRDALGRKLPYSSRPQIWRLRKWQIRSRAHASTDRNLAQAMAELDRLSDKLNIRGAIKENAAMIYRRALAEDLVRGRSIAGVMTAALYAACRNSETPRSLREISEISLVDKKEVARCYRLLLRCLNIRMPISSPVTYVFKIASGAGISSQCQGLALKILREARKKRVASGKDPMGLAAAALYIACLQSNERKTQKCIAEAAGVTEVTVRNRYKSLNRQLDLTLPD